MQLSKPTQVAFGIGALVLALIDPMTLPTPFHLYSPKNYGVTFEHLGLVDLLLFCLAYLVTTLFGLSLSWRALGDVAVSFWIKVAGAFVVGYTAALAPIRLISFFARGGIIYWLTLASLTGLSAFLLWPDLRRARKAKLPSTNWTEVGLLVGGLLFFLALQLYQGDFRWVGHGPDQYSFFLQVLRTRGQGAPFPLIKLHQDELLYTYFLTCPTDLRFDPILPMWITLALTKVSAIALIYCLFVWVGTSKSFSLIGTVFLSFGAFGLNPLKYLTYFSANNPLGFVAHSGRIIGVPLTLFVLSGFVRASNLPLTFYLFTGLGIALSYPSNALSLLVVLFSCLLFHALKSDRYQPKQWLETTVFCSAFLIPALSYQAAGVPYHVLGEYWTRDIRLLFKWPIPPGSLFVIFFAIFALFLGSYLRQFRLSLLPKLSDGLVKGGVFLVMFLLGVLFLGGMAVDNALSRQALSFLRDLGWVRGLEFEYPEGFRLVPTTPARFFVDARESPIWNQYNWGFPYFLAAYGGLYLLAGLSLRATRATATGKTQWLRTLQYFLVGYLALVFFFIDFIDNIVRSWAKSCFLEVPVYCILFLSFFLIDRFASKTQRRYVSLYAIAYSALPFLCTGRFIQVARNLWALFHLPR